MGKNGVKYKFCLVLVGFFLAGLLIPGRALAAEYFDITQYDVTMNVLENHAYEIQEDITVAFKEARHGIFREIPYQGDFYRKIDDELITTPYKARITNISVEDWKYTITSEDGKKIIKIGDANKFVSGTQIYSIAYEWDPGIDKITSMDDVYYNLIGVDWDTGIQGAHFTITMPKDFDPAGVEFITGSFGAFDTTSVDYKVNGNTIEGTLNRPLAANEGVTLKINLPDGYFSESFLAGALDFLSEIFLNSGLDSIVYGTIMLSLLVGFLIWLLTGRDKKPVETVEFYPPNGFTPPQVGYIVDGNLDRVEVLSLLLSWADQGLLKVKQQTVNRFDFLKVKDLPESAHDFENTLFKGLFKSGKGYSTVSIPENFETTLENTKKQITSYFDLPENKQFTDASKTGARVIKIIMALPVLVLGIVWIAKTGIFQIALMEGLGYLFLMVVPLIVSANLICTALRERKGITRKKTGKRLKQGIISGIVAILIILVINYISLGLENILPAMMAILATGLLAWLQIIAAKRTKTGNLWYGQVLGLKNFINRAEKDRIEALVDEDPHYFFKILPFAIVLGVTDKWVENFAATTLAQPDWYDGKVYKHDFSPELFANDYTYSMNYIADRLYGMSAAAQASTDQTNNDNHFDGFSGGSGFSGGGGTSGGGGGGGGGGSW